MASLAACADSDARYVLSYDLPARFSHRGTSRENRGQAETIRAPHDCGRWDASFSIDSSTAGAGGHDRVALHMVLRSSRHRDRANLVEQLPIDKGIPFIKPANYRHFSKVIIKTCDSTKMARA